MPLIPALQELLDNFDSKFTVQQTKYAWSALKPQPKQSTRFSGHAFTSREKVQYIKDLAEDLRCNVAGGCMHGPLRLTIVYNFPWTKKDYDPHIVWGLMSQRPDIDNLLKPLLDTIKDIVCEDDGQITVVRAAKLRFVFPCIALRADSITANYSLTTPAPSVIIPPDVSTEP